MNNTRLFIVILVLCSCFTGCGKNNSTVDITKFDKDNNTVRYHDSFKIGTWNDIIQDTDIELPDDAESELYNQMGELILENLDTSTSYEVTSDGSVVYNSRTFVNLNNVINSIDTKYDKNTLLNFIIKKHKSTSDTVYVTIETNNSGEDGDIEMITISDNISSVPKYIELREKYSEDIKWLITLTDSETRDTLDLYGCNSYILMPSAVDDVIVNMSEFDYNQQGE